MLPPPPPPQNKPLKSPPRLVLIRLIENWEKSLDQNKSVGAVLMDFCKVFYSFFIHDLLIAKMHGYGFSSNSENDFHIFLAFDFNM